MKHSVHNDLSEKEFQRDEENFKLKPLSLEETFKFSCHRGVSCFNKCCHQIDVILTPFDILKLKSALGINSGAFLSKYAFFQQLKGTGIPIVKLRMGENSGGACIFLDVNSGCTVYGNRPLVCRTYPIGSASIDPRQGESRDSHYIIMEEMCRGHEENKPWKLKEWMQDQGASEIEELNKPWLETVAKLKAMKLEDKHQHQISLFIMVCYDLDTFQDFVANSSLLKKFGVERKTADLINKDQQELLKFGLEWLQFALFGEGNIRPKNAP